MLTIKNKTETAEIYLSGEIVDDEDGGWVEEFRYGNTTGYEFPAKLKRQLDSLKDKELEIHINSYGGSVFAGVAMANFVKNHKHKTTAIIDGIAASIASQIFFSADVCKTPANGYLMIHRPFTLAEGNADDLRKAAEILDTIQAGLEETCIPKMQESLTIENLREMMKNETWLTGTEAAQYFKVELMEPVKVLNYAGNRNKLKAAGIKRLPAPLNFLEVESLEIEKVLKESEALLNGRMET